ncbi:hypothetical protein PFMG_04316 [Plasmodium falciparum IGH-CR14]|uniref:Uncharacterized protein n=1 Tax=Plasmodium falciparum IGH-CR14 TaxID=580059 RepID=A0A0L1IEW8_PLAFA|nr:hypothetical protein PFMG_04316 [Plasmodium falciparum IGH-CR14]
MEIIDEFLQKFFDQTEKIECKNEKDNKSMFHKSHKNPHCKNFKMIDQSCVSDKNIDVINEN